MPTLIQPHQTPASGRVIQVASFVVGTIASTTVQMPINSGIPQNTQGAQFMSLAITPVFATSILLIQAQGFFNGSGAQTITTMALFQDNIANALATSAEWYPPSGSRVGTNTILHRMVSGTTSPITFKIRAGSSPSTYTVWFNSSGAGAWAGGTISSGIFIWEVEA